MEKGAGKESFYSFVFMNTLLQWATRAQSHLGGLWKMTWNMPLSCLPKEKRNWGIYQLLPFCHWPRAASGQLIPWHFQAVPCATQVCSGDREDSQQNHGCLQKETNC